MSDYLNEQGDTVCGKCGKVLNSGLLWPFCPHPLKSSTSGAIERDEIPGGVTVENYGPKPITFYSHSERRAYMKAHGLNEREKFSPLPGTSKDPAGIPNPAGYVDPYTLESVRVLLGRNGRSEAPPLEDTSNYFKPIEPHTAATGERKRLRAALTRK